MITVQKVQPQPPLATHEIVCDGLKIGEAKPSETNSKWHVVIPLGDCRLMQGWGDTIPLAITDAVLLNRREQQRMEYAVRDIEQRLGVDGCEHVKIQVSGVCDA